MKLFETSLFLFIFICSTAHLIAFFYVLLLNFSVKDELSIKKRAGLYTCFFFFNDEIFIMSDDRLHNASYYYLVQIIHLCL